MSIQQIREEPYSEHSHSHISLAVPLKLHKWPILTFLLLSLLLLLVASSLAPPPPSAPVVRVAMGAPPGTVVVSTTTSGWTIISWEEYCVGSSVMVDRDTSEFMRGYTRLLRCTRSRSLGDGSGVGVDKRSGLSLGLTCNIKQALWQYTKATF